MISINGNILLCMQEMFFTLLNSTFNIRHQKKYSSSSDPYGTTTYDWNKKWKYLKRCIHTFAFCNEDSISSSSPMTTIKPLIFCSTNFNQSWICATLVSKFADVASPLPSENKQIFQLVWSNVLIHRKGSRMTTTSSNCGMLFGDVKDTKIIRIFLLLLYDERGLIDN